MTEMDSPGALMDRKKRVEARERRKAMVEHCSLMNSFPDRRTAHQTLKLEVQDRADSNYMTKFTIHSHATGGTPIFHRKKRGIQLMNVVHLIQDGYDMEDGREACGTT